MINFIYDHKKILVEKRQLYKDKDKSFVVEYQLQKLNIQWQYILKKFIFYSNYQKKNNLPIQIKSLQDFFNFPVISKKEIIENYEQIFIDSKAKKNTFTGGTSGPVTKFPTGFIDSKNNFINQIFLRESYDIKANDKCLYIWGHSHKFGQNFFIKTYKELIKNFKNFYFNRIQFSAYDLTEKNIKIIFNHLKSLCPKYILTYASTFSSILNYLNIKNLKYENSIKIILTSDNLTIEDFNLVSKIFPRSELINEFGMAETGVVGYSDKENFYIIKTLWDSFLIQSKKKSLILTDLNKRIFPLIRYSPDDLIECDETISILNFKISGKFRPSFKIRIKGVYKEISSIIFDHIFKFDKFIRATQYYWNEKKLKLFIFFTSDLEVNSDYLMNKLKNYFGNLPENIILFVIKDTFKTKAGKFIYHLKQEDLITFNIDLHSF